MNREGKHKLLRHEKQQLINVLKKKKRLLRNQLSISKISSLNENNDYFLAFCKNKINCNPLSTKFFYNTLFAYIYSTLYNRKYGTKKYFNYNEIPVKTKLNSLYTKTTSSQPIIRLSGFTDFYNKKSKNKKYLFIHKKFFPYLLFELQKFKIHRYIMTQTKDNNANTQFFYFEQFSVKILKNDHTRYKNNVLVDIIKAYSCQDFERMKTYGYKLDNSINSWVYDLVYSTAAIVLNLKKGDGIEFKNNTPINIFGYYIYNTGRLKQINMDLINDKGFYAYHVQKLNRSNKSNFILCNHNHATLCELYIQNNKLHAAFFDPNQKPIALHKSSGIKKRLEYLHTEIYYLLKSTHPEIFYNLKKGKKQDVHILPQNPVMSYKMAINQNSFLTKIDCYRNLKRTTFTNGYCLVFCQYIKMSLTLHNTRLIDFFSEAASFVDEDYSNDEDLIIQLNNNFLDGINQFIGVLTRKAYENGLIQSKTLSKLSSIYSFDRSSSSSKSNYLKIKSRIQSAKQKRKLRKSSSSVVEKTTSSSDILVKGTSSSSEKEKKINKKRRISIDLSQFEWAKKKPKIYLDL